MTKKDVIKKINHSREWFPKSYSGFLFGIDIQGMGLSKGAKTIPFAQKYGLVYLNYSQKDHWDWFWNSDEMISKRKLILARARKSAKFADNFYKAWEKRYLAYVAHFEKLAKSKPEAFTDQKAYAQFKKLYTLAADQASYGYVVDSFLTSGEEDWLVEIIREELGDKATSEVIHTLTAPVFRSFVNGYELAVLELALLFKNGDRSASLNKTREIERQYFWIKTNYLNFARLTRSEILLAAKEFGKDKNKLLLLIQAQSLSAGRNRTAKKKLIARLSISKPLQNILYISELFSKIQDKRKECVLRNNTLFYELLARLAKKRKLNAKLTYYLVHDELFSLLKGQRIDWKAVKNRYTGGALILYYAGTFAILNSKEIISKINLANLFPKLSDARELKGSSAFMGKVQGRVRILRNTKEIAKFPQGAVLVANQTTPEFVPAMKRAVAILTDQGGITSHAAIVSRELKIPCVVGIKNATKLLKDGDMVEVDANNGIVRKVS